jgi:sugar phosphate permease
MFILIFFNCTNAIGLYNAEIGTFIYEYSIPIAYQPIIQILNNVAAIIGSLYVGKLLDKTRAFKKSQIILAMVLSAGVFLSFLLLHFNPKEHEFNA